MYKSSRRFISIGSDAAVGVGAETVARPSDASSDFPAAVVVVVVAFLRAPGHLVAQPADKIVVGDGVVIQHVLGSCFSNTQYFLGTVCLIKNIDAY